MAIQSTYDPTSANPYEAPPPPQQGNVPGTDPMPAKPSPFGGQPGYQFTQGPISHGGAIAGIADNVLRGIVNGHAQQEQWKALKLKKKSDDLNASYQADAQRLQQVAYAQYQTTGKVDPSSKDYQAAKSAVDGSWGALDDFRSQLLEQQTGGGKKKGGKTKQGEPPKPPQAVLTDPNSTPEEKLQAIMGVSKKLGPPVYSQLSVLNSPQAAAHWQQQQDATQFNDLHSRNELTHEQALATYNKYAGLGEDQLAKLPQAQQDAFKNSKQVLWPPGAQKVPVGGLTRYRKDAKGNTLEYKVDAEGNEIPDTERPLSTVSTQGPKVGTFGDFMTAAYGAKPTPKQYVDGRKLWASSGAGTTTGEHVVMVPQPDNTIKPVVVMTTSTKSFGGGTSAPDTRQDTQPAVSSAPAVPLTVTQSFANKPIPGQVSPGNVDLSKRPNIDNGDGTHSSVFSMSFGTDKGEVLVPGVGDGKTYPARKLTQEEALDQYKKTGQNLGTFKTPKDADNYAQTLHEDQAKYGNQSSTAPTRRQRTPTPSAPAPTSTATPPRHGGAGVVSIGDSIGGKRSPEQTKAIEQADAVETGFHAAIQRLKHLDPPGAQAIVYDWVRAQIAGAGRMTNTEIQQAYNMGSLDQRARNAIKRATTGVPDPAYMRSLVNDIGIAARAARQTANSYNKPSTDSQNAPKGASAEVWSADGKTLLGHAVDGKFVALGK
jgi:hypothetical protein